MELRIFYDELQEGEWFKGLTREMSAASLEPTGAKNENLRNVERFLRYDRPDIILLVDGQPKVVVEKTSEVPTGHNVGQRFARIANAVEEKVMFVYFFPFKAMKHGTYANVCYVNARLFEAFKKMEEIHGVPVLAINWPSDANHELIRNGSQDTEIRQLVVDLIQNRFDYTKLNTVENIRQKTNIEYEERVKKTPLYSKPPPSVEITKTTRYIDYLGGRFGTKLDMPNYILQRDETLVYRFNMTPKNCRREDPYTGTQFIYDYIWCRNGPSPTDKYRNLVLTAPLVSKKRWLEANPNDPARKSSLYYATADFIVLQDGILFPGDAIKPQAQSTLI